MLILIRYGEIGLKSKPVRRKFEQRLMESIRRKLNSFDAAVKKKHNRIFAQLPEKEVADAVFKLRTVPGIVSVSPCLETNSDLDEIAESCLTLARDWLDKQEGEKEGKTFALRARRVGDHQFTSQQVEEDVGEMVRDTGLEVDLDRPDLTIFIETRDEDTYLYTAKLDGVGGLPLGVEGKSLALIEDRASIVAVYSLMKRGAKVIPVVEEKRAEEVAEGIKVLRIYDPDIKQVEIDSFEPEKLESTAELFDCAAVVRGTTLDDLQRQEGRRNSARKQEIDTEITKLTPNCGLTDKQVLEKYGDISKFLE